MPSSFPIHSPETFNDYLSHCNDLQYWWAVKNLKDMYNDCWDYIIDDELKAQFTIETASELRYLITKELNLVKRVITEISTIYKKPAERKAVIGDGEEEIIDENYEALKEKIPLDVIMAKCNELTNLTYATLVMPIWRESGLDYDLINFDNAQIATDPDDWKKIIALKYYIGKSLPYSRVSEESTSQTEIHPQGSHQSDGYGDYTKYSKGFIYTTESEEFEPRLRGKIIKFRSDGKDKEVFEEIIDNPYKDKEGKVIIPGTLVLKSWPVDRLIKYTENSDLMDLNINTAINLIHLNNNMQLQSYKQIVAVTPEPDKLPKSWQLGPNSVIGITSERDNPTSVNTLDLQTDMQQFYDVILNRIQTSLAQFGISAENFTRSGTPESGFKLKVKKEGLLEQREKQLPLYRIAEKEIFEKTRIVWNYHNPDEAINEEAKFEIDFADPTFINDKTEENENWIIKIDNNIASKVDWIRSENPDLDDDAAQQKLDENKAINDLNQVQIKPITNETGETDEKSNGNTEESNSGAAETKKST